jgi:hypothetical protein
MTRIEYRDGSFERRGSGWAIGSVYVKKPHAIEGQSNVPDRGSIGYRDRPASPRSCNRGTAVSGYEHQLRPPMRRNRGQVIASA